MADFDWGAIASLVGTAGGVLGNWLAADEASSGYQQASGISAEALQSAINALNDASGRAVDAQQLYNLLANQGYTEAANAAMAEMRAAQEQASGLATQMLDKTIAHLDEAGGQTRADIVAAQNQALSVLKNFGSQAAAIYEPYVQAGNRALGNLEGMAATGVQVPSDLTQSAYYPLYNFQKETQDEAIKKALAARGLFDSGYGITEQIKSDTGLTQSFTADEYTRAVEDYNRKAGLYGTLLASGQSAATNQAGIYNTLGQNLAEVYKWGGTNLGNANLSTATAKANASMNTGNLLTNLAETTGQGVSNILTNLGTQTGATALQQGTNLSNIYSTLGSNIAQMYQNAGGTQAQLMNSAAQNRAGLYTGIGNTLIAGGNAYLQNQGWNNYLNTLGKLRTNQNPSDAYSDLYLSGTWYG